MLTEAVSKPQRAATHSERAAPPQVTGASSHYQMWALLGVPLTQGEVDRDHRARVQRDTRSPEPCGGRENCWLSGLPSPRTSSSPAALTGGSPPGKSCSWTLPYYAGIHHSLRTKLHQEKTEAPMLFVHTQPMRL